MNTDTNTQEDFHICLTLQSPVVEGEKNDMEHDVMGSHAGKQKITKPPRKSLLNQEKGLVQQINTEKNEPQ